MSFGIKHPQTDIASSLGSLINLSGMSAGSKNLGTFAGTLCASNATVKETLQTLETNLETLEAADDILRRNIQDESMLRVSEVSDLQNQLGTETTNRMQADTALNQQLSQEIAFRTNADNSLRADINAAAYTRAAADSGLDTKIINEIAARTSADAGLNTDISNETAARTSGDVTERNERIVADALLQTNINTLASTVTAGINWKAPVENIAAFIADKDNMNVGDVRIVKDLHDAYLRVAANGLGGGENLSHVHAALGLDFIRFLDSSEIASGLANVHTAVNTEGGVRASADADLQSKINAEINARVTANDALNADLNAETSARTLTDTVLQSNIDTEKNERISAVSLLQTNVNTVSTNLGNKANISDVFTKAETENKIAAVLDGAPEALDTLKELSDALANDANFANTLSTQLATKADQADVFTKVETENKIAEVNNLSDLPAAGKHPIFFDPGTREVFFDKNQRISTSGEVGSGVEGPRGPPGIVGSQGSVGDTGNTGLTGPVGPAGLQGLSGSAVINNLANIPAAGMHPIFYNPDSREVFFDHNQRISTTGEPGSGAQGARGPSGAAGPAGADGTDGINGNILITNLSNLPAAGKHPIFFDPVTLEVFFDKNQRISTSGEVGSGVEGPRGPAGLIGSQGLLGPAGPIGATGAEGNIVAPNLSDLPAAGKFPMFFDPVTLEVFFDRNQRISTSGEVGSGIEGPRGPQGTQGPVGQTGAAGEPAPPINTNLLGVASDSADLGTFSGGLISANSSVKQALQQLESAIVSLMPL